jgi:uncharacterized protein
METQSPKSYIPRFHRLEKLLEKQKVLLIYGPRRSGKTTLVKKYLEKTLLKYRFDSGDSIRLQQLLGSQDFDKILPYAEDYDLIVIDEAQQIPNIGMGLKILTDHSPNIQIIATGSSSFELSQQVGEPLTGRKRTEMLYPLSQLELTEQWNNHQLQEKLPEFLIYGSYPEVITARKASEKRKILTEIVDSYLLKDILQLGTIRGTKQLFDLLKLVAFQVGSEVSLHELATQVNLDVKTVGKYLDIFEKAFILKRLGGYSRNLRKEVVSKAKYFFVDNGIRNAIIEQFNPLPLRNDAGTLFENFIISERIKMMSYKMELYTPYFWRTYDGQEIDLIEEYEGKIKGYEVTWSRRNKKKEPIAWKKSYPQAEWQVVSQANYLNFLQKTT